MEGRIWEGGGGGEEGEGSEGRNNKNEESYEITCLYSHSSSLNLIDCTLDNERNRSLFVSAQSIHSQLKRKKEQT